MSTRARIADLNAFEAENKALRDKAEALELERDSLQAALDINDGFVTGIEAKLEKAEARLSKMEEVLMVLSDPMAYEHIGKFHGRKLPWSIAKEALESDK